MSCQVRGRDEGGRDEVGRKRKEVRGSDDEVRSETLLGKNFPQM